MAASAARSEAALTRIEELEKKLKSTNQAP